jgi:hypothetical protein
MNRTPEKNDSSVNGSRVRTVRSREQQQRGRDDVHDVSAEPVEQPPERRPHDLGRLRGGHRPRGGARDLRPGHEGGDEGRGARILERARGSGGGDDPEDDRLAQPSAERPEGQRRDGAGDDEPADADDDATVVAVGGVPDDQRQQDHRRELHEADEAEVQRAAGQGVDLPADRHRLHVERDRGEDARAPVQRERRMTEQRRR